MTVLLTTDPGLEDVAADEVAELRPGAAVQVQPYGCAGHVGVEGAAGDDLLQLSTIHHILEVLGEGEARTLEDVKRIVGAVEIPEMHDAESFRVTSDRVGEHEFGSVEIQRAAGAAVYHRYGTRVDLEQFDVEVRANLYGTQLVVGLQRTSRSLAKRILRAAPLRSALKPTVAAAMLRLVGAHRGEGVLLDPLCGAGTIPIEARRINPALEVFGSDWDAETVEVARATVANHGLEIPVEQLDARTLGEQKPEFADYIVTDPPYGVRQARHTSLSRLFGTLLPAFEAALKPGGRIAIVVLKYRTFISALERTGLTVVEQRLFQSGGLKPRIVLLERGSARRRVDE